METKSLWGNLSELETIRTPKEILEEQALALTSGTNGLLVGHVDARQNQPTFAYDLDVMVPLLNNYVYTILSINHRITLYPVTVTSATSLLPSVQCENEEQYTAAIERILSSKETKYILSRLLSQVTK
jgi:hypothetical protein